MIQTCQNSICLLLSSIGEGAFGVSPVVQGGHPHPGPPPEISFIPPEPRYCQAPCAQECAPACMDWCCYPAIQPPPPVPAVPVPAPLPYGQNAFNGVPGLPQPQPPAVSMQGPNGQVMPQMPMMQGMKKHKVEIEQSKSKENKKDTKLNGKKKESAKAKEDEKKGEQQDEVKEEAKKAEIKNWD